MARASTAAVRLTTGEREPVRLATTANITTVEVDGLDVVQGLQTIDGVVASVGDRVLVKDQTDQTLNGIYTASEGTWYRASDSRSSRALQKGTTVTVQLGSTNAGKTYRFTTDQPNIGTDNIVIADVTNAFVDALNATNKALPVDADRVFGSDSANSFSVVYYTWTQIKAFLFASPALTGNPTAPTPSPGDNDTSIATTGFVKAAIDVVLGGVSSAFDTLSEIATDLGLKMVKTANLSDVASVSTARQNLIVSTYVATRTAMKALDTTKDTVCYLTEAGREGIFKWTTGNFTTRHAADTAEGLYVKATAIASSAGSWVRQNELRYDPCWFGAAGDGSTNDTTAVQAAETMRALTGATLDFGTRSYLIGTITVSRALGGAWTGANAKLLARANSTILADLSNAVGVGTTSTMFSITNLEFDGNGFTGCYAVRETNPFLTTLDKLTIKRVAYCYAGLIGGGASFRGGVNISNIMQYGMGSWKFSGVSSGVTDRIFACNISNIVHQGDGTSGTWVAPWFEFYRAINMHVSNVVSTSLDGGTKGVSITGACEGIFIDHCITLWPTTGFFIDVGADAVQPTYIYLTDVAADQPTVDGFDIDGEVVHLTSANATFGDVRTNSGSGCVVRSTAKDVHLNQLRCSNMYNTGLKIEAGAKCSVYDFKGENNPNGGAGYDVDVGASTAANVVFYGKNEWSTSNATVQTLKGKVTNLPLYPGDSTYEAGIGKLYTDATRGTVLTAQSGATWDFLLTSRAGTSIFQVPSNTGDLQIGGAGIGTAGLGTAAIGGAWAAFGAGTTGLASANFAAGTNKTTVAAGDWEYDGKALYFAHAASSRGVVPSVQMVNLDADRTGSDVSTAQAWFASTEDAFTVVASTTYRFHAVLLMSRAAGSTSHTTGFLLGGTATFTSIQALARVSNPTGNVLGAESAMRVTAATETVLTAANTATTEDVRIEVVGTIRVNGAGTIIPQFKYSAAPGGAPTIQDGTFFEIWPVGSNTMKVVGNIA